MLSRATRAARLLWREWWEETGYELVTMGAAFLAFLALGAIGCVILSGVGALARLVSPTFAGDAPRPLVGFLVLAVPYLVACLLIAVINSACGAYGALRSAWERAGREG